MPIRAELRHFYSGPEWDGIRARILARAGNQCERCAKPNGADLQVTRKGIWYDWVVNGWRNDQGEVDGFNCPNITGYTVYTIRCVLTVAHLDHDPTNNADENLQALCQHCHLKHDRNFHYANSRRTRAAKAGQQWLSRDIEQGVKP